MTIRTRLFALLLPTMALFVILISLFFFFSWKGEIIDNFQSDLKSIVVTTADLLDPQEMAWILAHRNDPSLHSSPTYKKNWDRLQTLQKKLPVDSIYVVAIEQVKVGEPVIVDQPVSETNKIYDGTNSEYSHRQVYIIDTEKEAKDVPYYDYSESNEQLLYSHPKAFATAIYQAKGTDEFFMSGFAPLMDENNRVIALLGANLNVDLFDRMVHRAILLIILSSLVTLMLVGIAVYLITNKISEPVKKLKDAALSLAAGEYEEKISVAGPREIVELANTYNTMRECLLEHITRLRDISFSREMLFGEQECALLLQNRMVDGEIDRFEDPRVAIKHITMPLSSSSYGFKLLLQSNPDQIQFHLLQSSEEGFEGIYKLLESPESAAGALDINLNFKSQKLKMYARDLPTPLCWSQQTMRFREDNETVEFKEGDLVFIFNRELAESFPTRHLIKEWLSKVVRQFGKDPLELLAAMLGSELNFWQKKQPIQRSVHLYVLKVQNHEK